MIRLVSSDIKIDISVKIGKLIVYFLTFLSNLLLKGPRTYCSSSAIATPDESKPLTEKKQASLTFQRFIKSSLLGISTSSQQFKWILGKIDVCQEMNHFGRKKIQGRRWLGEKCSVWDRLNNQ